jgi:hypothetical protein
MLIISRHNPRPRPVPRLASPLRTLHPHGNQQTVVKLRTRWHGLRKGDSIKAFEQIKQQFSPIFRQFALNVGFEHTARFSASLSGLSIGWRMVLAELENNTERGGPELNLERLSRYRRDRNTDLKDKMNKTRSQIPIHPYALLAALPADISLIKEARGPLAALREKLRVVEGRRLCLYTYYNPEYDKGEYHIALVPQSTQVGDLICRLNGDARYFAFREVATKGRRGVKDGHMVCDLVV